MTEQARDPESWIPWRARIIETAMLTDTERFFRLEPTDGQPLGQVPGQFVQVCLPGIGEAPISIASAPNEEGTFDLVVRKVGNLTEALHQKTKGHSVGIRGPFGRGFPIDSCSGRDLVIIAGGIGLVPLRSLIQYGLMHRRRFKSFSVLYGAKRPAEMLFKEELIAWQGRPDTDFHITVDVAHRTSAQSGEGVPEWVDHLLEKLFQDTQAQTFSVRSRPVSLDTIL